MHMDDSWQFWYFCVIIKQFIMQALAWARRCLLVYAHGHPKEACQQKLTGARRGSRGEGHSPI